MKKFLVIALTLCCAVAFGQDAYNFKVDLNKIKNDQLDVELTVEPIKFSKKKKELIYHIPKIVPGTYSVNDYGRFTSNFKAFDHKGRELEVRHPDANTWIIKGKKRRSCLAKITYTIEDSWDTNLKENFVFEPAGTNFEKDKNFVFNNHAMFGYFKGKERVPYYLTVERPEKFFGAGSLLRAKGGDKDTDVFYADSYHELVDAPMMFCEPDTATLKIGNADVLISTYSANGRVSSKFLAGEIAPILEAQRAYLGGTLPVDRYAFILYLTDQGFKSGAYGALEHSYSSMYCLPEGEPSSIAQTVRDVAAHEFFHIVTPLNIHSEEIHNFDYISPKMSKHLWLYEGVTEYASGHVQVKHQLMDIEEYLGVLAGKMRGADNFQDDLPFTKMSKGCLHDYKNEYTNVYQKGALIGACLDIQLLSLSNGQQDLRALIDALSKEYGKDKAFKDDELFDKIEELSKGGKGVRKFLDIYVAGPKALPIEQLMKKVGIKYEPTSMIKQLSWGGLSQQNIGFNGKNFFLASEEGIDAFGKKLGYKKGDVLLTWNGEELNPQSINGIIGKYIQTAKEGDDLTIEVMRGDKKTTLKTEVVKMESEVKHNLQLMENATAEQIALRKAWLGEYLVKKEE